MGDMADLLIERYGDGHWDDCDHHDPEDYSYGYDRRAGSKLLRSVVEGVRHRTAKAVLADTVEWGPRWLPLSQCVFNDDCTSVQVPAWLVGRWLGTGV